MRTIIDEPFDLVAFAVSVDRWLLLFADGRAVTEHAVLDAQAEQMLRRDDVRALLESALQDAPQDVFAIASRIILVLVPSAVAGTLPLSFDPPLVAALALRIFQKGPLLDLSNESTRPHSSAPNLHRRVQSRRSRRRWIGKISCEPAAIRSAEADRQAGELDSLPSDPDFVEVARRPKHWHCIACGWRCDQSYNDYLCGQCGTIRPFVGGSATMMQCRQCHEWNLALARFCEWCGAPTT
ncbi:MAG TPA: hypothetical protein VGD58_11155 [Herpetosiphonaceae bacterium]